MISIKKQIIDNITRFGEANDDCFHYLLFQYVRKGSAYQLGHVRFEPLVADGP